MQNSSMAISFDRSRSPKMHCIQLLVSLIERFYQPSVGIITLDGQDIGQLNLKWLHSQIGYVPQEPVLFNTTIADNIRYGALFRDVSEEEIVAMAKACHIHDFIESLPQVSFSI